MIRVAPVLGENRITMVKIECTGYLVLVITNAKQNLGIEETAVLVQRIPIFNAYFGTAVFFVELDVNDTGNSVRSIGRRRPIF